MTIWEKDEQYGIRLDEEYDLGERFLLNGAEVSGTIETSFGTADVCILQTERIDNTGRPTGVKTEVQTVASAIVDKFREAEPEDFPAVVQLQRVESKRRAGAQALVLRLVQR